MVSMAENRTLSEVLTAIVNGIAACKHVALARIWLLQPADICASCKFEPDCPDQTRCLHLVASAGNAESTEQDLTRIDGKFRRLPIGHRKIGRIASTGEPLLISDIEGTEEWIAHPEWIRSSKIKSFAAHPLVFRNEILGVLAIFDRATLNNDDFKWLRIFADHAAVSITNANAFEEIAYLKERLEEENSYLREEVTDAKGPNDLVGNSPALKKVLQQIQLVASTDATVLITGESGTGKELIARAIHEHSNRREQPLIKINCGAVPESLFESEFFGHVKGAFTGALRDKAGRFELANHGTLFLDEIGEMPMSMQAKLLRVLQEHEVERLGDTRTRKIDVRIIAASNRDLKAEVEAGKFRADLFYRLSVFPIENPALRERAEDIPYLAEHFIRIAAKRFNRKTPKLTAIASRQLIQYHWPGNVRELQNTVERAVILAQNGPLHFDGLTPPKAQSASPTQSQAEPQKPLSKEELRLRERQNIVTALAHTGGKIFGSGGAAQLLGMPPTTLASRIKALAITRKESPLN